VPLPLSRLQCDLDSANFRFGGRFGAALPRATGDLELILQPPGAQGGVQVNARGTTLIELIVVVALLGLSITAVAFYLAPLETPLKSGTVLLEGYFRQVRRQAMATTSAYRAIPQGTNRLIAQRASSCLDTSWTDDPLVRLTLPDGVGMTDSSWTVCFSSRGISESNVIVTLSHPDFGQKQVEVLIGGTTRVIQ
jgi:hypothetical protein